MVAVLPAASRLLGSGQARAKTGLNQRVFHQMADAKKLGGK